MQENRSLWPGYRDGVARVIGFEIGKELTRSDVALGINADECR